MSYVFIFMLYTVGNNPESITKQLYEFDSKLSSDVSALIQMAEDCVKTKNKYPTAAVCIRKIGRLRAKPATSFLIDNLLFDPEPDKFSVTSIPTVESSIPAVYALSEIGVSAIDPLINKAILLNDDTYHKYTAFVILRVYKYDIGKYYLEKMRKTITQQVSLHRIDNIIMHLEKYKQDKWITPDE